MGHYWSCNGFRSRRKIWRSDYEINFIAIIASKHLNEDSIRRAIHRVLAQTHGLISQCYWCYNSTQKKEKKNTRQYEASKPFFFRFDKSYRPREYDETNKVLQLSQTGNTPTGKNGNLYLYDICNKQIQITIWIKKSSKELHSTSSGRNCRYYLLAIANSKLLPDLNSGNTKKLNLIRC